MTDPTTDTMLAALGSLQFQLMRELSDRAEELGDIWLAAGWRYLADRRLLPLRFRVHSSGAILWDWSARECMTSAEARVSKRGVHAILPDSCLAHIPGFYEVGNDHPPYRRSFDACALAGAVAVGKWLEEDAARDAKRLADEKARKDREGCKLCGGTGRIVYGNGMNEACPKHPAPTTAGWTLTQFGSSITWQYEPIKPDPRFLIRGTT